LPFGEFLNTGVVGVDSYLVLIGLVVFAEASFFFALAESALFALGKWRAMQLAEQSASRGGRVVRLLERPPELLATIALGNTISNAVLVALGLREAFAGRWPLSLVLPGIFLLVLVGCEVVPKTLAVRAPERWALRVAPAMLFLQRLSGPLQRVVHELNTFILERVVPVSARPGAALTDPEYHELLELAYQQGTLAASEKEIILEIISLDQRTAQQVMVPLSRMHSIADDLSIEEMIVAARRYKHRRLPIYDGTPDTIVGVLNTQSLLLDPQVDLADVIELPSFVPETMNLLQLFKSLQRQQRGLAIVLDEFGGTAGLVTVEDILEEVVGKIRGEGEPEGFVMEKLSEGRWRVNGTMGLDDFRREFPDLGRMPGVNTMGGLVVALLEVVPVPGQTVLFGNLKLTAHVADARRVREVLVEVNSKR
jgi:CBS domain containing-hemolysin-like protein